MGAPDLPRYSSAAPLNATSMAAGVAAALGYSSDSVVVTSQPRTITPPAPPPASPPTSPSPPLLPPTIPSSPPPAPAEPIPPQPFMPAPSRLPATPLSPFCPPSLELPMQLSTPPLALPISPLTPPPLAPTRLPVVLPAPLSPPTLPSDSAIAAAASSLPDAVQLMDVLAWALLFGLGLPCTLVALYAIMPCTCTIRRKRLRAARRRAARPVTLIAKRFDRFLHAHRPSGENA
eukprot:7377544-Prymnesium_polylepis.1